jgi:hypothetical protein
MAIYYLELPATMKAIDQNAQPLADFLQKKTARMLQ